MDQFLLQFLYAEEPDAIGALFERNRQPLIVLVIGANRRLMYANEEGERTFGCRIEADSSGSFEVTDRGWLWRLIDPVTTTPSRRITVQASFGPIRGETWHVVATPAPTKERSMAVLMGRNVPAKTKNDDAAHGAEAQRECRSKFGLEFVSGPSSGAELVLSPNVRENMSAGHEILENPGASGAGRCPRARQPLMVSPVLKPR